MNNIPLFLSDPVMEAFTLSLSTLNLMVTMNGHKQAIQQHKVTSLDLKVNYMLISVDQLFSNRVLQQTNAFLDMILLTNLTLKQK